ncbi:hypothetical protein ACJ2A9_04235 [Anaerobacillus sp. MEB173]|uniref:hypothetical protein n=1 Tax=Anaerobacillus sp. MEB173 TaxID=3383345 RepID=UPI003F90823A
MSNQPQTYFEKMEKVNMLTEKHQTLIQKYNEYKAVNLPTDNLEDDLRKIEEEMKIQTNGYSVDQIKAAMNNESLFLPNHLEFGYSNTDGDRGEF